MSFSVIIPARYASTRLPGKPLLDINGKPMIQHVYERASQSKAERIIIATDDQRIADVVSAFGAEVCMTSETCESGTDRLQEVVQKQGFADEHIVVNVQGDEPLIPPAVINQVADDLATTDHFEISTLIKRIKDVETVMDPNAVKVVMDLHGCALYFSRAPLPWYRDGWPERADDDSPALRTLPDHTHYYRHIGIYAYRVSFLHKFVQWPASSLELAEKLEQLRALEHGVKIKATEAAETIPAGIDTEQDLEQVRALFI